MPTTTVERVPTETHVTRELLYRDRHIATWTYKMLWEGTTIARAEVSVIVGVPDEQVNFVGLNALLRAVTS